MLSVSKNQKTATLARISRKSPAQPAEIPVFEETIGGDGFDRHCAIGMAVEFAFARSMGAEVRSAKYGPRIETALFEICESLRNSSLPMAAQV